MDSFTDSNVTVLVCLLMLSFTAEKVSLTSPGYSLTPLVKPVTVLVDVFLLPPSLPGFLRGLSKHAASQLLGVSRTHPRLHLPAAWRLSDLSEAPPPSCLASLRSIRGCPKPCTAFSPASERGLGLSISRPGQSEHSMHSGPPPQVSSSGRPASLCLPSLQGKRQGGAHTHTHSGALTPYPPSSHIRTLLVVSIHRWVFIFC